MKRLLIILLTAATTYTCKAQSIIVPLGSGDYELNSNYYLKDVNNVFGKFVGTWVYQNGNTEITFKLKKEELYQISNQSIYRDLLVGEYRFIENGIQKANTLMAFNSQFVSGYKHKINGGVFKHTLPGYCVDNSAPSETKVLVNINHPTNEFIKGHAILRHVNTNGVETLQVCIYDYSTLAEANQRIDIPDGYYVFTKQ